MKRSDLAQDDGQGLSAKRNLASGGHDREYASSRRSVVPDAEVNVCREKNSSLALSGALAGYTPDNASGSKPIMRPEFSDKVSTSFTSRTGTRFML